MGLWGLWFGADGSVWGVVGLPVGVVVSFWAASARARRVCRRLWWTATIMAWRVWADSPNASMVPSSRRLFFLTLEFELSAGLRPL